MSTTANSSAPLTEDYVVELLSETGKRRAIIGTSSNVDAIHDCYDEALAAYPHTTLRMRQDAQIIAQRVPQPTCMSHKDSAGSTEVEDPPELRELGRAPDYRPTESRCAVGQAHAAPA